MNDNRPDNIIIFDPMHRRYSKMWKENRWQFSGELVKLNIKLSKVGELSDIEQRTMDTLQRVIDDNDGKWTEGYEYNEGVLTKIRESKQK